MSAFDGTVIGRHLRPDQPDRRTSVFRRHQAGELGRRADYTDEWGHEICIAQCALLEASFVRNVPDGMASCVVKGITCVILG